jgi:unsaturated rhamnogalacturonyl hydrolase
MICALLLSGAMAAVSLDTEVQAVAALPGEPHAVSAAGVTRADTPLLTIENPSPFEAGTRRRLVIVGGLDGDVRAARAVLSAVRWFKTTAPARVRQRWAVSALPLADPDGHARIKPFRFPPIKGFFDDHDQPESRYVWRWVAFQAPDLVVDIRGAADAEGELKTALAADQASGLGSVPVTTVTAREADGAGALRKVITAAAGVTQSPLHDALLKRIARDPVVIAATLAKRYPENPSVSYISAVAWASTLRLASRSGDPSLRAKVREQTAPWVSGEKKAMGNQISLTAVAGTMIFAELATTEDDAAARGLALEGASLASAQKSGGLAQYGQGWTDDMFMATAILARVASFPGHVGDLDTAARLLIDYAARLQRPDGIFVHATDGPVAWGRGNGFAALGLMEALTALPERHPARSHVLEIFQRQMAAVKTMQAPDGMWRQIIDEPGAYREETATAMLLSAMARGIRLGWLDRSYVLVVQRAWRALAAHVAGDGTLVDVCAGTGAGPTKRYYLDRPAMEGGDDRGGAMALLGAVEMEELGNPKSAIRNPAFAKGFGRK